MIISPTFGWKKTLGKCCLALSSGTIRLITLKHILVQQVVLELVMLS
jgi:hypothetical protein